MDFEGIKSNFAGISERKALAFGILLIVFATAIFSGIYGIPEIFDFEGETALDRVEDAQNRFDQLDEDQLSDDEQRVGDAIDDMSDFKNNTSSGMADLRNVSGMVGKEKPQEIAEKLEEAQKKLEEGQQNLDNASQLLSDTNETEVNLEGANLTFDGARELEDDLIIIADAIDAKSTGIDPFIDGLYEFGEGNVNSNKSEYQEAETQYEKAITDFNQSANNLRRDRIESPTEYNETFNELICTAEMLRDISVLYHEGTQAYIEENTETGDQKFDEGDQVYGRCN